ncbi:uncharacterized protein LOC108030230 isoform X2 [Drosophila biarmipes]|nr:uncharacterized protein LOC108030230 isoform X2 [Drosophila biarmipes]
MTMIDKKRSEDERQLWSLKEVQKKHLKTIAGLEQKVQEKVFLVNKYAEQISILKSDARVIDDLRKENSTLKALVQTLINENMKLKNLGKWVQKDLRNEVELKRKLQERVSHLENDLYQAQKKLQSPGTDSVSLNSPNAYDDLNDNSLDPKQAINRTNIHFAQLFFL